MTGMTGGAGNPAVNADVRSRLTEQSNASYITRTTYSGERMQGMSGRGSSKEIWALAVSTPLQKRDVFSGMRKLTSRRAVRQSIREMQEYTNNL